MTKISKQIRKWSKKYIPRVDSLLRHFNKSMDLIAIGYSNKRVRITGEKKIKSIYDDVVILYFKNRELRRYKK